MTRFFLRHGAAVVVFWLVLVVVSIAAVGSRFARELPIVDNSVGVWFLADDPDLRGYQEHNHAFKEREWSLILLEAADIWDTTFLADLDALTRELQRLDHVHKVVSLTNARDSRTDSDSALEYVPLWSADLPAAARADSLRSRAGNLPALEGALIRSGDRTHTGILLLSDNFLHDPTPYRMHLVDSVRAAAGRHGAVRTAHFAGTTVVNAELNRSAGRDAIRFYLLVTLLLTVVGYVVLRSLRDLSLVLSIVTISVGIPMGLLAALGQPYNMVTIMLPPILVSLSVCDVVHVVNAFHIRRRTMSAADAIDAAIRRLLVSCIWTTVVTVIGFVSLVPSTVLPIRQLGWAASLGLVFALLSTLSLAPVFLERFWRAPVGAEKKSSGWKAGQYAAWLLPRLFGRLRPVWIAIAVLGLVPLFGLSRLEVDTDYTRFFTPDAPLSRAYAAIDKAGWGQSLVSVDIAATSPDSMLDPRWRDGIRRFEAALAELPDVRKTLSQDQILRRVDDAWSGGSDSARFAGYAPDKVGNLRLLAELSGNDDLEDFQAEGGTRQQILALTPYMGSTRLTDFRAKVDSLGKAFLPASARVSLEGTTVLWANMDRQISRTQVSSFLALALVFLVLLPLLFRSFTLGIIGVLINGIPLCMTFGLMGLLDVKINLATALIGGVSIGSTVDSTIFFINRFRSALAEGAAWNEAVRIAVLDVGDGILVTSVLLAGGFFCMASSSFLPTAHFGLFTTFTVVTAAFLDIVIDPLIIAYLGRFRKDRT